MCGQAFGAGQYHMMGIYLQRSWIVDAITTTILVPLFVFSCPLFISLGEEEDISIASEAISLWFIPSIYSYVFSSTIQMYLQAQLKNLIVGWLSAASFVLQVLLSWIFVTILGLGVPGAMGAFNISSWLLVLGEFVYIFGGWCPNTWKGFTAAAFTDIWPVLKLSISSGVMLCLELWYNAILVLLAGYMKNATVAIAAFSICLNICQWEFMIFLGLLGAISVRVSNELGRGNAKAALFSIKVILSTSICLGVVCWVLCLIFGNQISYMFTSDEEVAEAVSSLSSLLAFSMLLNSVQPILTGVAIGAGLQSSVAIINICSYYVFGIPIGLLLGYVVHLEVTVKKASERLHQWVLKSPNESN
ncbi:Protein TRANSPARENT TESTA 12 [Morella rubra]|uniref:Protein TRANSPARENT TESTA 12 n=1 Tax=Morella rubra TaxID=262757 RepID=A0A6A1WGX4_9ROSI|nr:Protein TRANSPARENT TESTA 12 [Morella rubra]